MNTNDPKFIEFLKCVLIDRSAIDLIRDLPELYPVVAKAYHDQVIEEIKEWEKLDL